MSPTALNFKKVPIGQTSAPQVVTLTNVGSADLNISSITANGDFQISNNTCGAILSVGANCKVSVTFTPTKKGARAGTLTFNDNAPGSPQTVTVKSTDTTTNTRLEDLVRDLNKALDVKFAGALRAEVNGSAIRLRSLDAGITGFQITAGATALGLDAGTATKASIAAFNVATDAVI